MNLRPRSCSVALGLLAAGTLAPCAASAQFVDRLSLHGEIGFASMLSSAQRNTLQVDNGLQASLHGGIAIVGPLSVQLGLGMWNFPAGNIGVASSQATFTGGLRFDPALGSFVRLAIDGNIGAGITIPDNTTRLAWDASIGLEFHLFGSFYIGPQARIGQLLANSTDSLGDATYLSGNLVLGIHPHTPPPPPPPPPDTDHDGVPDPDDLCPTVPAGVHPDPQRRGCPLGDRDNDGVLDPDDQCPDTPAGDHPDAHRPGCPLGDRDHDGVYDPDDQCPDTPAGDHPDPHRPGCPDGDDDHDGVLNAQDPCPTVPAGDHPDPARPGCPLPDRDGDTVPDAVDHCPDQPGAPSPDPLRNGCPGLVQITGGQVHINRPVFFATNRDTILRPSFPVLQAVADALQATPAIHRVAVEGHTDNVGPEAHNMELSQHRAESVMHWLTAHGIDAARLEAHGYGPSRPIATNATAAGRAINRRVEFHIVDPAPTGDTTPPAPAPAPSPAEHPAHPAEHTEHSVAHPEHPVAHPHPEHHPEHPATH